MRYLHSTALSKEERARTLAERDQVREGLIGLFDIVEPCLTSEFATDIMFESPAALASIYPQLVQHGIQHSGSAEVLRFLGRVVPAHGRVHRLYKGEVETSLQTGPRACV